MRIRFLLVFLVGILAVGVCMSTAAVSTSIVKSTASSPIDSRGAPNLAIDQLSFALPADAGPAICSEKDIGMTSYIVLSNNSTTALPTSNGPNDERLNILTRLSYTPASSANPSIEQPDVGILLTQSTEYTTGNDHTLPRDAVINEKGGIVLCRNVIVTTNANCTSYG